MNVREGLGTRLEPHGLKHVPEHLNDLQSQHVLPHVVPHLEDTGLPHPLASQLLGQGGHLWRGGENKGVVLNPTLSVAMAFGHKCEFLPLTFLPA